MSLMFTFHWLEPVTLPSLNYKEGLGNVGEHVEKWKSITVLVTCDKTIENKRKFNIKYCTLQDSVYFGVGEEGSA